MAGNERRRFLEKLLLSGGAVLIGGCDRLAGSGRFRSLLALADKPTELALRAVTPADALAREFTQADLSPVFKANGSINPQTPEYLAMVAEDFASYRLRVSGLVRKPLSLSLVQLRALPSRTQITRHDCVEGWSCIGKWKGTPLGHLIDLAGPQAAAKFVVFHCADDLSNDNTRYYESIHLFEAYHPQSILAYDMNDAVLGIPHGAPLRVRLERKLGYKMAKYIVGIELVDDLAAFGSGQGGFWEDRGYQWHGGI